MFFFFANSETSRIDPVSTATEVTDSSFLLQHRRQVCVEFQALRNVWKGAAQSGGIHPGQEVTLCCSSAARPHTINCLCGPSKGVSDEEVKNVGNAVLRDTPECFFFSVYCYSK